MYLRTEGTMKHQRPSDPQLPRSLWESFEREFPNSFIFSSVFPHIRQCIVSKKASPNSAVPVTSNLTVQCLESGTTCGKEETEKLGIVDLFKNMGYLHLAAFQGDLPLAYEARRLGTSVRIRNKDGFSALYFGCRTITTFMGSSTPSNKSPAEEADDREALAALRAKISRVCVFLLSHHSDPNETHDGLSLLHLACMTSAWDLIHALLLHGADPSPSSLGPSRHPVRFLKTESDRARFRSLISEAKNSTTERPPRVCPCASGLPVESCHGVPGGKLYPQEHLCCCGTRRIYSACCGKQSGKVWIEEWNEVADRLETKEVMILESLLGARHQNISDNMLERVLQAIDSGVLAKRMDGFRQAQDEILNRLGASGQIDPAFVVAIRKVGILVPYPAGVAVTVSKGEWRETIAIWNGAVDTYIVSGIDSRSKETIENAAKMSIIGGPLYRRCEASGCTNIEGRNSVQLQRCMRCQAAVYCGRACQKSAWSGHKLACQSGKVKAQLLPSQRELLAAMARATGSQNDPYVEALS
ncbi:hypothetical protein MVEN_02128500 [Mycena venus]|uniref:MYND-type domain-containing protein n=1 Tax=Mycena venus TaxID=2733690 RepID=A0A8H6XA74_9AGAR|nr:hypothetical protein MVEN_02128500 [Mycena venus]